MVIQLWHQAYQHAPIGALYRSAQKGGRDKLFKRPQLTSPLVAETILKQFDFSEYKGCQIIDINPGLGVWSSFLNAAIQPSKHLLLEPKESFSSMLNILKHTHSSFDYHATDGTSYEKFDDMIQRGLISAPKTPHDGEVNKDILLTCHLQPDFSGRRILHQLLTSIATRSWYHSFGRVRMLIWCDEADRQVFIPRSIRRRKRAAVYTELLVDCQELAGGFEAGVNQANLLEMIKVQRRLMEAEGTSISVPKGCSIAKDGNRRRARGPAAVSDNSPLKHRPLPEDILTYHKMSTDPKTIFVSRKDFVGIHDDVSTVPTLISFTPRVPPHFLANSENFIGTWELFDVVVRRLFMKAVTQISESIQLLGPGAGILFEIDEELAKTNIKEKRCCDLTLDEFVLIVQAYDRWPYKDVSLLYDDWQDRSGKYDKIIS